jgi:hypothetical protein
MPNSVSSDLTIATAVSVLTDLLAPINAFTKNISSEVVGRQATVKVPVIGTDDSARDYAYSTGYNTSADSDVTLLSVPILERIKPFHLVDNDMNKSPLTLQSYVKQNAHEFGRYLLNLVHTAVDAGAVGNSNVSVKLPASVASADIKTIMSRLDAEGAPMDRHLIINSTSNSGLLPTTIETFGTGVLEGGRFNNLYGMQTHVSTAVNAGAGKVNTFGCSSDAIVVVNRMPDVSGAQTLEEYTPFTIDGIGLQCAYRRYYDATKGEHFGAFTTNFGCAVAKKTHIAGYKDS